MNALSDIVNKYTAEEWSAFVAAFPDHAERAASLAALIRSTSDAVQSEMYLTPGTCGHSCKCFVDAREAEYQRRIAADIAADVARLSADVARAVAAVAAGTITRTWTPSEGKKLARTVIPGITGAESLHADIQKNVSIRLHGVTTNRGEVVIVDRTFRVGDACEYASYNLSYHGVIVSISDKRIVIAHGIQPYPDTTLPAGHPRAKSSLKLEQFAWRNWDFDLAKSRAANSDTMVTL